MSDAAHKRSVIVWDVPPALVCGDPFTLRLGVKCESGCPPAGWMIEVRDHDGRTVLAGQFDGVRWPGTEALFGADIELTAPDAEGLFTWEALAPEAATAGVREAGDERDHAEARASFRVRTVAAADCRLTVTAVDRASQSPVAGAKVVVHPFRAVTDARGVAELDLPKGRYRLFVTGHDFFPLRLDGELVEDLQIRAELEHDRGPSDAELWS